MTSNTIVQAASGMVPDLPAPFVGTYEMWTDVASEQWHCVLNLFADNVAGKRIFVRTFHGWDAVECDELCEQWICCREECPAPR